jgi:hypothetical protein
MNSSTYDATSKVHSNSINAGQHDESSHSLIVHTTNTTAAIYRATLIQSLTLPISIFESSAIFMTIAPGWWKDAWIPAGTYFVPELPINAAEDEKIIQLIPNLDERRAGNERALYHSLSLV